MIKEKRATLEQFIKEQLIGPGGCNYRYSVFHTDDDVLNPECAYGEVLNTTPGSIYSSAICSRCNQKKISNLRRLSQMRQILQETIMMMKMESTLMKTK